MGLEEKEEVKISPECAKALQNFWSAVAKDLKEKEQETEELKEKKQEMMSSELAATCKIFRDWAKKMNSFKGGDAESREEKDACVESEGEWLVIKEEWL